jgi:hypothetical protein
MSLGHQACLGGTGCCEGRGESEAPVALGTAVDTEVLGGAVTEFCGAEKTTCTRYANVATALNIVESKN